MRSINLKWLNLTLRSDEPNSTSENFLKTPKIKRLEIRGIVNRQFSPKIPEIYSRTVESVEYQLKTIRFYGKIHLVKMINFERNAYFDNSVNFHENI